MNLRPFAHHALSLSLGLFLLPAALAAGDAVVVNANGTTQFAYTVSGPNLLGTAAPVALSGTTTLDSTAAGKLYTISGTTANYTITLPPAGIGAGTILGFSVAPLASADKQYTIATVPGETLDGRASLALIHTNYLEVMSVGGQWISRVKKVDTDWVKSVKINFLAPASGTAPTAGVTTRDWNWWRRVGDTAEVRFELEHTSGGNSGGGHYVFMLPAGLSMDTNKVYVSSSTWQQTGSKPESVTVGVCQVQENGSNPGIGVISPYSSNGVRLHVQRAGTNNPIQDWVSSSWYAMAVASGTYSGQYAVPIVNW